jgi:hypothetical protein
MNFEDFLNRYILGDGQILAFRLEYETKKFQVKLKIRRLLTKQKLEPCLIEFEFTGVSEIYFFEDFPTDGGCTDVTFVRIDNEGFYLSLDPYGNIGMPHEEDNLVVKAEGLTFIDEEGVRQNIS